MPRAAYPGPVKCTIIAVVIERRPVTRTDARMGRVDRNNWTKSGGRLLAYKLAQVPHYPD